MAEDDDDKDEGGKALQKLEGSAKTIRTLFVSTLIVGAVLVSVLITGVVVLNLQLSNRNEVPAEAFAEQLALLESYRQHLITVHNAEAKAYYEFQDSLQTVVDQYEHESVNQLRRFMTERERDHRKLLELMSRSVDSLAQMQRGSRQWTEAYAKQVEEALKRSQEQEKQIKLTLALPEEETEEGEGKDGADKDKKAK